MKRLYLGRVALTYYNKYELGTNKKDWDAEGGFSQSHLIIFCSEIFERLTNVKLKGGELMEVESINFKLTPIKKRRSRI